MKKLNQFLLSTLVVAMFLVFSTGGVQAGPCELPDFASASFDAPTDNYYLPIPELDPGEVKTYVYEAEDEDGLIRDYISFSTDTETILSAPRTVVYDVEFLFVEGIGWRRLEETQDYHDWDNDGNFWYFGEDTIEFEYDEDWYCIGESDEGSWNADDPGVFPGIILPAEPKQGDCYQQEYAEDEAEDVGKVLRLNARCEDPVGNDSEECMVMKEWTALEPGNVEHKHYFPGVGLVYIKELKEKTVEFELIDINSNPIPNLHIPICN